MISPQVQGRQFPARRMGLPGPAVGMRLKIQNLYLYPSEKREDFIYARHKKRQKARPVGAAWPCLVWLSVFYV
jgi:hypothetical protein